LKRILRFKERNAKRIEECTRSGKVEVLFQSNPLAFKANSVILDVAGQSRELPNDFVWIFAGGEPPSAFLKRIGVGSGVLDITAQGSTEAKNAAQEAAQAKLTPA
jgi:thioredoxin reductase (NADPH)